MDEKNDIVVHGGNIVVMNGNIIMGPCEKRDWRLLINGLSFYDFSAKIDAEKITDYYDSSSSSPVEIKYMPMRGSFSDSGSKTSNSGSDYIGTDVIANWEWNISGADPLGLTGFQVFQVDESGVTSRISNLMLFKEPREGVFLIDMGVVMATDYTYNWERVNGSDADYREGHVLKDFDVFIEFEVNKTENGGFELARQETLSSTEAYGKYRNSFAFITNEYRFSGGIGGGDAYYKGTIEMDIDVSVVRKVNEN